MTVKFMIYLEKQMDKKGIRGLSAWLLNMFSDEWLSSQVSALQWTLCRHWLQWVFTQELSIAHKGLIGGSSYHHWAALRKERTYIEKNRIHLIDHQQTRKLTLETYRFGLPYLFIRSRTKVTGSQMSTVLQVSKRSKPVRVLIQVLIFNLLALGTFYIIKLERDASKHQLCIVCCNHIQFDKYHKSTKIKRTTQDLHQHKSLCLSHVFVIWDLQWFQRTVR